MSTVVVKSISELRGRLSSIRNAGKSIGLVPTMGALHAGHVKLLQVARAECDYLVASIFVNPTQFNQAEDFQLYPRNEADDVAICSEAGVDVAFCPEAEEMYPPPQHTYVEVEKVSEHLCGAFRPGHFRGVATVVLKLLNIVQPDRAYFGEKDAQQLAVIRRMVFDLNVPVAVVPVPTVRESDGLALSSRNRRLSARDREAAPGLYEALQRAAARIAAGEVDAKAIRQAEIDALGRIEGLRVEYFEVVDADEMQPVETISGPVRIAAAIWLGGVRLIDNVRA